ncbi:hypothetical protein SAMN05443999_101263 [Roseovarius azorensis]|uniref:Uncharacterized protein n=1 Tax=Roseovarius azorensis TaxID=1287727 RepID=A0A1H7GDW6_9RHOB|nr:hypothetical protein [Roseovarius azorensis]SEK35042.1 hypothetical protein SAMN05443999_101263 [Roseovarius azorensis]
MAVRDFRLVKLEALDAIRADIVAETTAAVQALLVGNIEPALQLIFESKADAARVIAAGTGLTGGGDLSLDRTLALSQAVLDSLARADSALQPQGNLAGLGNADAALANLGATDKGKAVLKAADAAAQREALELKGAATRDISVNPDFSVEATRLAPRSAIRALVDEQIAAVGVGFHPDATFAAETRADGTTYQNPTEHAIFVYARNRRLSTSTDNVTWSPTLDTGVSGTDFAHCYAPILPGHYYRLFATGPVWELRWRP